MSLAGGGWVDPAKSSGGEVFFDQHSWRTCKFQEEDSPDRCRRKTESDRIKM